MAETANIELNIDEIYLLIKYLDCDVCAEKGCLDKEAEPCSRAAECRTLSMWEKLYDLIREYLGGVTLADLMVTDAGGDNYVI